MAAVRFGRRWSCHRVAQGSERALARPLRRLKGRGNPGTVLRRDPVGPSQDRGEGLKNEQRTKKRTNDKHGNPMPKPSPPSFAIRTCALGLRLTARLSSVKPSGGKADQSGPVPNGDLEVDPFPHFLQPGSLCHGFRGPLRKPAGGGEELYSRGWLAPALPSPGGRHTSRFAGANRRMQYKN